MRVQWEPVPRSEVDALAETDWLIALHLEPEHEHVRVSRRHVLICGRCCTQNADQKSCRCDDREEAPHASPFASPGDGG
jgi:hypothetical protein